MYLSVSLTISLITKSSNNCDLSATRCCLCSFGYSKQGHQRIEGKINGVLAVEAVVVGVIEAAVVAEILPFISMSRTGIILY